MFLPLVDVLRCINAHADTWLVASIDRAVDRDIREGTLGCPQCNAEYPIRDGVVRFSERVTRAPFVEPREADAARLAAALDLTDARMTALLYGVWGAHAQLILGLSPSQLLLVNPPEGVASGDGISILLGETAPLAQGSMQAAAVDASATSAMIASAAASLSAGGRMLGPVSTPIPSGFVELARDGEVWVAQLERSGTV
ncbi:MAG TPA: hypothetical protein VHV78_02355, partial [Gemmatimonadaceae bacterium]|nr:hypothetical protein [Gemmatimonadaceae bacterium]